MAQLRLVKEENGPLKPAASAKDSSLPPLEGTSTQQACCEQQQTRRAALECPPAGKRQVDLSLPLSLSLALPLSLSPTVPLVLAEYLHFTAGSPQVQQSQRFVCGRQLSFFRQGCDAGEFPPLHRALCAPPTVAEGKRCYAPRGFWAPVSKKGWPPSATALSNWNEKQSDCQCNLCSQ